MIMRPCSTESESLLLSVTTYSYKNLKLGCHILTCDNMHVRQVSWLAKACRLKEREHVNTWSY